MARNYRCKFTRELAYFFIEKFPTLRNYQDFRNATLHWTNNRLAPWRYWERKTKPSLQELMMACDIAAFKQGGQSKLEYIQALQEQHQFSSLQFDGKRRDSVDDPIPPQREETLLDDLILVEDDELI